MQPIIDFAGLNKLDETEREQFKKTSMEFCRILNVPADITVHIKKSDKITLNARIVMDTCVLNIKETDYDALSALIKLFEHINSRLRAIALV